MKKLILLALTLSLLLTGCGYYGHVYDEGYAEGYEIGYDEGHTDGYYEGVEEGLKYAHEYDEVRERVIEQVVQEAIDVARWEEREQGHAPYWNPIDESLGIIEAYHGDPSPFWEGDLPTEEEYLDALQSLIRFAEYLGYGEYMED